VAKVFTLKAPSSAHVTQVGSILRGQAFLWSLVLLWARSSWSHGFGGL